MATKMKKMIAIAVTIMLVLTSMGDLSLIKTFAATPGGVTSSITKVGQAGVDLEGSKTTLISKTEEINLRVSINPTYQTGEASDLKLELDLPYFYYDNSGILMQTINLAEVPEDQRGENLMGIEATPVGEVNFFPESGTAPYRGLTKLNNPVESLIAGSTISVEFKLRFFGPVPENTIASVKSIAGYDTFKVNNTTETDINYTEPPSGTDGGNLYTLINTNLVWNLNINQLSAPVLWDRYNYIGYEIEIANDSADDAAIIENSNIKIRPANFNDTSFGVIDSDIMKWKENEDGEFVENTEDFSHDDYQFIGKAGDGGALIWDVTDKSEEETKDWNLENYLNIEDESVPYTYTTNKDITFNLDLEGNPIRKGESRKYYIAIPIQPNLPAANDNGINVDIIGSIIYDTGANWSKTANDRFEFSPLEPKFEQNLYILNAEGNPAGSLVFDDDLETSIHMDSFKNTTNTPVFNAYSVNTLPEGFDMSAIEIVMNKKATEPNTVQLEKWFSENNGNIVTAIVEKDGEEQKLPLGILTIKNDSSASTIWQIENSGKVISDFLTENPEYTFTGKLNYDYKKRIEIEEGLDGKIIVKGYPIVSKPTESKLQTNYETWTYSPMSNDPVDDSDYSKNSQSTSELNVSFLLDPARPLIKTESFKYEDDMYNYSESTAASMRKPGVGFNYVIGNESSLPAVNAKFESGVYSGSGFDFLAEEIVLSKALLDSSKISSVIMYGVKDGKETQISFNESNFTAEADGSKVLTNSKWLSALGKMTNFEINFSHMDDEVALDDNNYIRVEGQMTQLGTATPTGKFSSYYENSEYDITVSDDASITVEDIIILMSGQSRDDAELSDKNTTETINDYLTVPSKDNNTGYHFELKNDSKSAAPDSDLIFDMSSSVSAKGASLEGVVIAGFRTDSIVISKNHGNVGNIREIRFYDYDQEIEEDSPALTLSAGELGIVDGNTITVNKSQWEDEVTYLKGFVIEFESIEGADLAEARETLEIDINGETNWYDNLDAVMTFKPQDDVLALSKTTAVAARLQVPRPELKVQTNVEYEPIKETTTANSANLDGNQTILGIPYNRDFNYKITVRNEDISKLDDTELTLNLPINDDSNIDEENTGFHTTRIEINEDIVNDVEGDMKIALFDIDKNQEVLLIYEKATDSFVGDGISIKNNSGIFTITEENLEALGINELGKLRLDAKVADFREADTKDLEINIHGYLDSNFGTSNIISATADNFLNGVRDNDFRETTKDSSNAYLSELYFDTVISATYNDVPDDTPEIKADQASTPVEHVRQYYRAGSSTAYFNDNSELEIGYKAMGSFMVDFRQYLNVGTNYPAIPSGTMNSQDHQSMPYIYTQSLNTALNVETTVDIPEEIFEAYYIKVDPRAINYINSITVVNSEGNSIEIAKETILNNKNNGVETDESGEEYFRINLLSEDAIADFATLDIGGYDTFFKNTDSIYESTSNIDKVIINLNINEEQSDIDGNAKNPDYGTWYNQNDQTSKYMFEITGRYFKKGNGEATATSTISTSEAEGENRSKDRFSSGEVLKTTRSPWSFENRYNYYYYSSYSWRLGSALYDSGHLQSTTRVTVKEEGIGSSVGANGDLGTKTFSKAIIGDRYTFPISLHRTSPVNSEYEMGKNGTWYGQDPNNWAAKVSHVDKVTLTATLPKIRPDEEAYYGFLTKDITIKKEILENLEEINIYERTVVDTAAANNPTTSNGMVGYTETEVNTPILTITKANLADYVDAEGNIVLDIKYEVEGETENPSAKKELYFEEESYPSKIVVVATDLKGNGDYAREYAGKTDLNKVDEITDATVEDIVVGGEVYSTVSINPVSEASLMIRQDTENDQGQKVENINASASMQGFRIPFSAGHSITAIDGEAQTDYQNDNIAPTISAYELNAWNRSDGGTDETEAASIKEVELYNQFSSHGGSYKNSYYNMKTIYIPETFIDGSWFGVNSISLNSNSIILAQPDAEGEVPVGQLNLKDYIAVTADGKYYALDIDKVMKNTSLTDSQKFTTYTVKNSEEQYVSEHISNFRINLSAKNPSNDGDTVLNGGQYLTSDKTKGGDSIYYEGTWVNRSEADFNYDDATKPGIYNDTSRPTFDTWPNFYNTTRARTYMEAYFTPYEVNAQPEGSNLTGTVTYDDYLLTNLTGEMVVDITRGTDLDNDGSIDTFAYDKQKGDGADIINKVSQGNLMPFDYLDFTLSLKAGNASPIPLERSYLEFTAPEGMRIVGWEIKSNSTGILPDDITATAVESGTNTETELAKNTTYFYKTGEDPKTQTDYKTLNLTIGNEGAEIAATTGVEIIVHTQITDETINDTVKTLEGQQLIATYEAKSDIKHTYPQYRITGNGNSSEYIGASRYSYREPGTVQGVSDYDINFYRNREETDTTSEYVSKITARNSVAYEDELTMQYQFDDATSQYDNQPITLKLYGNDAYVSGNDVESIVNDSDHHLETYVIEMMFFDEASNFRNFKMTSKLNIIYDDTPLESVSGKSTVLYPSNIGHNTPAKIEYLFESSEAVSEGEQLWVSETEVEERPEADSGTGSATKYVDEAIGLRVTYFDIPATGTDGELVTIINKDNPLTLKGLALYNKTTNASTNKVNDTYNMEIIANSYFTHDHNEIVAGDEAFAKDFSYSGSGETTTLVRRERPIITFQTQVFETEEEAREKYVAAESNAADRASQKIGYRPNDGLWYKFSVKNQKVEEATNATPQGALIDPVFYDKIPEYVNPEDIVGDNPAGVTLVWYDAEGNPKDTMPTLTVSKSEEIIAKDYGGDMVVDQPVVSANARPFAFADTIIDGVGATSSNVNSSEIVYNVYTFSFPEGTRLEVGESIEVYYNATVRSTNLPITYTEDDGKVYPEYYPKVSNYGQNANNSYNNSGYPFLNGAHTAPSSGEYSGYQVGVNNSTTMMDMNYLYHDVGISGSLNPNVDKWEYLNGAITYIPGNQGTTTTAYSSFYGNNGRLTDYDMNSAYNAQKISYVPSLTGTDTSILPTGVQYLIGTYNRDMFTKLLSYRYDNINTSWDGKDEDEKNPIVWSSSRMHLETSWIAASSQIVPLKAEGETNLQYANHGLQYMENDYITLARNPNYNSSWDRNAPAQNWRYQRFGDDSIPTVEYQEEYIARLGAYNYGDWGVDGIEFTYVLPLGTVPELEGGNLQVSGKSLTSGNSLNPVYEDISSGAINAEIIQDPENDAGYRAPQVVKDPLLSMEHMNNTGDSYVDNDTYYDADNIPYVVKITVNEPLDKWFNRGSESGYIMYVDLACRVAGYTENGYFYDQVLVKPIESAANYNHLFSQVYDMTVFQGDSRVKSDIYNFSNQYGGMDVWWRAFTHVNNNRAGFSWNMNFLGGSPNMPYINGYNIQNEEVVIDGTANGSVTNLDSIELYSADAVNSYASTGTRAKVREPLVRVWNTLGDANSSGIYGTDIADYYLTSEVNHGTMNIHLENKYYRNSQSANAGNSFILTMQNYATNGGNQGTLFYPVIENILPKNFIPVDIHGEEYTTDNEDNSKKTLSYEIMNGVNNENISDSEKPLYDAAVEYIEVTNEKGGIEGRYKVSITPKNNTDGQATLESEEERVFRIPFVTTHGASGVGDTEEETTILQNAYQENITTVSSQLHNFKFKIDNDISGNPYNVGDRYAGYIYTDTYPSPDVRYTVNDLRKDAVVNSTSTMSGGYIPSQVRTILGLEFPVNQAIADGGVNRIYEGTDFNIETFPTYLPEANLTGLQTDYNRDGEIDTTDQAIMTGIVPKISVPYVYMETYINKDDEFSGDRYIAETTEEEINKAPNEKKYPIELTKEQHYLNSEEFDSEGYSPIRTDHFTLGDNLWFTTKVVNGDPIKRAEFSGDINHAKLIISTHLPSAVRYQDDYEIQFEGPDGSIEVVTKEEIESEEIETNKGWKVKILKNEIDTETNEQILVFEILTPSEVDETLSKEEQYNEYIGGKNFSGYIESGSEISLKVKTRVSSTEDLSVDPDKDYWDNDFYAKSYITFKDTEASYLEMDNLFPQTIIEEVGIREAIEFGSDFDLDGTQNGELFLTDESARFSVVKPEATSRADTGIPRQLISLPGIENPVTQDTSIKSSSGEDGKGIRIHLDQQETLTTPLSQFIVDLNLGYRGSVKEETTQVSSTNYVVGNTISSIGTGKWEIPQSYKDSISEEELKRVEEELRVYVYVRNVTSNIITTEYEEPKLNMGSQWKLLGDYGIYENVEITKENSDLENYNDSTLQVRYVIKSSVDPSKTLVPEGFGIAIDADLTEVGVQDMDDVDPNRLNVESLPEEANNNSAYVHVQTLNKDVSTKVHINHFTDTWGEYADGLIGKLSETSHAGYFIDAESPSVIVDLFYSYLKYNRNSVTNEITYRWDSSDVLIKSTSSIVKYQATISSLTDEQILEYTGKEGEEDILSNPQIVMALPKVDNVNQEEYISRYIDSNSAEYETAPVNNSYIGGERLDEEDTQWTYYVVDTDGNRVNNHNIKSVELTIEDKLIAASSADPGAYRTLLNFDFKGHLNPGQTIVADMMIGLDTASFGLVSTDSLIANVYNYKDGSFRPIIGSDRDPTKKYGYLGDTLDLNSNDLEGSEVNMTVSIPPMVFDEASDILRNKYSYSEYEPEGLQDKRPSLVPEGTEYSFRSAISVRSSTVDLYENTIIYDVLPHLGDTQIKNTKSPDINEPDAEPGDRNSTWTGWLDPESIVVNKTHTKNGITQKTEIIDSVDADYWIGPFNDETGEIVGTGKDGLPAYIDRKTLTFYEDMYGNTNERNKGDYFIKLADLISLKTTDPEKYASLSKEILGIWVQMKDTDLGGFSLTSTFELEYNLEAPLNLPLYDGVSKIGDTDIEVEEKTENYQAWNTYVINAERVDGGTTVNVESPRAGVYLGRPSEKGYLGSYVWLDENFDAEVNEGDYTRREDGRLILNSASKDLDYDGEIDDPGINGVEVELLTEDGYPANKEGVAVAEITEGGETKYVEIDELTGKIATGSFGEPIYTLSGPAVEITESDAYGNEGYFIFSNLEPGDYKLRYRMPNGDYNTFAVTTKEIGDTEAEVDVYRDGMKLPNLEGEDLVNGDNEEVADQLVVQTKDSISVDAIGENPSSYPAYDEKMTSYNLGVSRDYIFSGIAWRDETSTGATVESDGQIGVSEERLANAQVKVYEVVDGTLKEAYQTNGELAEAKTDDDGRFEVSLIPFKEYVAKVDTSEMSGVFEVTPIRDNNRATVSLSDNDTYENAEEQLETTPFYADAARDGEIPVVATTGENTGKFVSEDFVGIGLITKGRVFIGGSIWDDLDYNGIKNQYYNEEGIFEFEPGHENVTLILEKYYYDKDTETWIYVEGADTTVTTDAKGSYLFQNLSAVHDIGGETLLAGYKVKLDLTTMPDGNLAITKYQANNGAFDSDLPRESTSGYLHGDQEAPLVPATIINEETMEFVSDEDNNSFLDLNGGFKTYEPGSIAGEVFFDKNSDGVVNEDETYEELLAEIGSEDVEFTAKLETYYLDGEGKWQQLLDETTGEPIRQAKIVDKYTDGKYIFENLPTRAFVEEVVPEITDPDITDPGGDDPDATDPDITDPDVTDPDVTDPETKIVSRILGYKLTLIDNTKITESGDIIPTAYLKNNGIGDSSMYVLANQNSGVENELTEEEEGLEPLDLSKFTFGISKNKTSEVYSNGEIAGHIVLGEYQADTTFKSVISNLTRSIDSGLENNFDLVIGKQVTSYNAGFTNYIPPVVEPDAEDKSEDNAGGIFDIIKVPQTGDERILILFAIVMLAATIGLVGIRVRRKKAR